MEHIRSEFDYQNRLRGSDAHVLQNIRTGFTEEEFHSYYGITKEMARRTIKAFHLMDSPEWNANMLLQAIKLGHYPFIYDITDIEKVRNAELCVDIAQDIENELSEVFTQQDGLRWMGRRGHFIFGAFLQREENRPVICNWKPPVSHAQDVTTAMVKAESTTPLADNASNEALAALFDLVTVEILAKMFPTDKNYTTEQWKKWAERAARNGLKDARYGRKTFNPYDAGVWFLTRGVPGWDIDRLNQRLVKNLPARSRDEAHLITGELH